jgi:hypothetical protein
MIFKRGNMVRAGKSRPPAALAELVESIGYVGMEHYEIISTPNLVFTFRFKKPVGRKIKLHKKANKVDDFSGDYLNLKSTKRCTPGIHMGYNKTTGKQNQSSAVIPGPHTIDELFKCVREVNAISEQCAV